MNKRYYEHTLPIIRGSLSNTYFQTSKIVEKVAYMEFLIIGLMH